MTGKGKEKKRGTRKGVVEKLKEKGEGKRKAKK